MVRISKHPEERRRELVEAAAQLFKNKGYDETSVSDIVRSVNVAQGTFYYHFQSKTDILEAVVKQTIASLICELEKIVCMDEAAPVDRLNEFFSALARFGIASRPLYEPIHRGVNSLLHERLSRVTVVQAAPLLAQILRDGDNTGTIDVTYADETARLLLISVGWMFHPPYPAPEPDTEQFARVRQTVESGVARILGIPEGQFRLLY